MGQELEKVEHALAVPMAPAASGMVTRAEIDTLIETARKYPRSISVAMKRMFELATLDEQAAEVCMYSLPRGGKTIEGPSVRFAEMAAQSWGNCRIAARTVNVDRVEKYVEAEGFFLDAETNVAMVARTRRRIVDKHGKLYNDDMIITTSNAAQSIARRNAILFGGIPNGAWQRAYDAARHVLLGDISTLANKRADAIAAFTRFGLTEAQILAIMRVKGVEDIDQEKLVSLRGTYSALRHQEITVEDLLREIEPERPVRAPVTANIVAPAAFAANVPDAAAATPAAAQPPVSEPAPTPAQEAAPPQQAAPAPTVAAPEPDISDSTIVANDIISRVKGAATLKALEKAVKECQQDFDTLPEADKARVHAAHAAATAALKQKAS